MSLHLIQRKYRTRGQGTGEPHTALQEAFKSPSSSVSVSLSTPLTLGCAPHLTPSVSESHVQPTGGIFHSENKVGIKIFFGSMEQFLTDISFLQSSKLLARYHAVMEVQILL